MRTMSSLVGRAAMVTLVAGSLAALELPGAVAAAACPTSGGAGTQVRTIGGIDVGKACFSFGDKKLRANDVNADSASTLAQLDYGSNYAQQWDTNGADDGWEVSNAVPVGTRTSVKLRTCAYDLDASSGEQYWGCSLWKVIYRAVDA